MSEHGYSDPNAVLPAPGYSPQLQQQVNQVYAPPAPAYPAGMAAQNRPCGQKRGPWAVWLLPFVTLGIYYLVWYYKTNKELAAFAPEAVQVNPGLAVLAQFVPIVNYVSMVHTAQRLNAAHAAIGSPVRVSGGMTILSSFWYSSHTRYLQRRVNALWDAAATPRPYGR